MCECQTLKIGSSKKSNTMKKKNVDYGALAMDGIVITGSAVLGAYVADMATEKLLETPKDGGKPNDPKWVHGLTVAAGVAIAAGGFMAPEDYKKPVIGFGVGAAVKSGFELLKIMKENSGENSGTTTGLGASIPKGTTVYALDTGGNMSVAGKMINGVLYATPTGGDVTIGRVRASENVSSGIQYC